MKRTTTHEPSFVLHRYDWSESSLILEVFSRHYGRVAVVAKGAKRPSSNFRPILLPMQPLRLTWSGDGEIRTLKAAEWVGGHVMPIGEALLSGYYTNELLMRLLPRDDPHPALFDAYTALMQVLAGDHGAAQAVTHSAALRAFELVLLREAGLLPVLDAQTSTLATLLADARYVLRAEGGLVQAVDDESASLTGAQWVALQHALDDAASFTALLRVASGLGAALRLQLRTLLNYHCGVSTLKTRQVMMDLQSL